jgi:glycerol kinase
MQGRDWEEQMVDQVCAPESYTGETTQQGNSFANEKGGEKGKESIEIQGILGDDAAARQVRQAPPGVVRAGAEVGLERGRA